MNKSPYISVIMSVYNTRQDYLKECIESILNQSYSDFEFIIVDDCANDATKEILHSYTYDPRVKIIVNESNKGLTNNLNTCLSLAKGKYIARMDADDIADVNRFSKQVSFLESHDEIAVLGTYYYLLKDGKLTKSKRVAISPDNNKARWFFTNNGVMHGSVMMRSDLVNIYNYSYNPHFKRTQDYDIWVRISKNHNITVLPNYLMTYRISSNQISNRFGSQQLMYFDEILKNQLLSLLPAANQKQIVTHLNVCKGIINDDLKALFKLCKELKSNNQEKGFYSYTSFNYYANYYYCRNCIKSVRNVKDVIYAVKLLIALMSSWFSYFYSETNYQIHAFNKLFY